MEVQNINTNQWNSGVEKYNNILQNEKFTKGGIPWQSSGQDSALSLPRTQDSIPGQGTKIPVSGTVKAKKKKKRKKERKKLEK